MTRVAQFPVTLRKQSESPTQVASVHTLHPGDVACAERGEVLNTLLGSCVAVILTDPRRTVGAMCHIVHSKPPRSAQRTSAAYAEMALDAMECMLQQRGISAHLCEAYVYGGGNMFPQLNSPSDIGEANASWALTTLRDRGIRVLACDLGGSVYRRLRWTVGYDEPFVDSVSV